MRLLSKSKLVAFRQCPKRLWLEVHRPGLAVVSARSQAVFATGHQVGDIARQLYDPAGQGGMIDLKAEGVPAALARTRQLLQAGKPVFEAGFAAEGGLAFADVLLPESGGAWRMVEVKASASVKDYQREDVAIQSYIARAAGIELAGVAVAHIDNKWIYPGGGDYAGLLKEADLTTEAMSRHGEVKQWIADAQQVVQCEEAPDIQSGHHCTYPFECGFIDHCNQGQAQAEYPVQWLPRIQAKALKAHIADHGVTDMRDVPANLLNGIQRRVQQCTLSGQRYFDAEGAADDLEQHGLPGFFLDFETIMFAVPMWAGTRPFQQVPFQFSVHRLDAGGVLSHEAFLDLSGGDPSQRFVESLVASCGSNEPVFVYNATFEGGRISELALRFPQWKRQLHSIRSRLVDLWPIAQRRYYHPSQKGSWSIKDVLPGLVPDLGYNQLDGVANGGMAQEAYLEAIHPDTGADRREDLRRQLLVYCGLDTLAMVRIWEIFAGVKSI